MTTHKLAESRDWPGAATTLSSAFWLLWRKPHVASLYIGLNLVAVLLASLFPGLMKDVTRFGPYSIDMDYGVITAWVLTTAILPVYALLLVDGKFSGWRSLKRYNAKQYINVGLVSVLMASALLAVAWLLWLVSQQIGIVLLGLLVALLASISLFSMAVFCAAEPNSNVLTAFKASPKLLSHNQAILWGIIGLYIVVSIGASLVSSILDGIFFANKDILQTIASSIVDLLMVVSLCLLYRWIGKNY